MARKTSPSLPRVRRGDLRCCVLTPDRGRVYDEFVDSVEVHTTAGRLEIFHRFEPTIAPLRIGVAKAKGNDGSVAALAIHGGYMNMNGKVLLILADSAELGDEINLERAQKALDRARELLAKVTSDHADSVEIDIDRAKLAITRALTRLNIAREAPYPNHDRTRDREVF